MTETIRMASYCRTSGEGQRDNTSIPRQREDNEAFCAKNGWALVHVYVDESKSGAKVEGRDEFQQMMKDAASGAFDGIVVYDITRFARKGADIIATAQFLKSTFGIFLLDTKGQFDTRKARNALINHVHAGISEQERISIMERTIGGRIRRAEKGEPWLGTPPFGRAFDQETKKWYVTEAGHRMRAMLERYADGGCLTKLCREHGFSSSGATTRIIREGQLSGTFIARFNSPEIDIENLEVPVPGIPEVITPELAERVRQRRAHNRTLNKEKLRKYRLTGYVVCGKCGASLTSAFNTGHQYYRHNRVKDGGCGCGFRSIRADLLEAQALGYLYQRFMDEPAFEEAVRQALPTTDQRDAVVEELARTRRKHDEVERAIANLVRALEQGADVTMLISRQEELRTEREALADRVAELDEELAVMPDENAVEQRSKAMRLLLYKAHGGKDWRTQSYDDIRQFLRFLFGDNPRQNGYGISVIREEHGWRVKFRGRVEFGHELYNGFPTTASFRRAVRAASKLLHQIALAKIDREFAEDSGAVKPDMGNLFGGAGRPCLVEHPRTSLGVAPVA